MALSKLFEISIFDHTIIILTSVAGLLSQEQLDYR